MNELFLRLVADGSVVVIVLLAFYAFIWIVPKADWIFWATRIVLAGITTYLTAKIIAVFYQPETLRPFEKLGVEPGAAFLPNPGFPSDHALFAMFLVLAVWFSTRNKWLSATMLGLTLVMGFGRVAALVHTPLDVIGGFAIAFIGIIWYRHTRQKIVQ